MNWKEFVFLTVSGLNQDGTKPFAGEEREKIQLAIAYQLEPLNVTLHSDESVLFKVRFLITVSTEYIRIEKLELDPFPFTLIF